MQSYIINGLRKAVVKLLFCKLRQIAQFSEFYFTDINVTAFLYPVTIFMDHDGTGFSSDLLHRSHVSFQRRGIFRRGQKNQE